MVFGRKSYSEITVTLVWTRGTKQGNSSFNKCIFFSNNTTFFLQLLLLRAKKLLSERRRRKVQNGHKACEHSRSLQHFVQRSKYKENTKWWRNRVWLSQLFIPEFKTRTWGKRLGKKVSWRVGGSRRAGGFRDISLIRNQLNKLLRASDWALTYRGSRWISERSWSGACFSEPTKCSLACSHLWEGSWAGAIAAGEEGRAERTRGRETRVFCKGMSVGWAEGAESALFVPSPAP